MFYSLKVTSEILSARFACLFSLLKKSKQKDQTITGKVKGVLPYILQISFLPKVAYHS